MAKQLVERFTCDLCGAEGFDPAEFRSLTLAAAEGTKVPELRKPLGFDACAGCMESEPVATLLKVGYPMAKPKAAAPAAEVAAESGGCQCRTCGRVLGSAAGRAAHERWCQG